MARIVNSGTDCAECLCRFCARNTANDSWNKQMAQKSCHACSYCEVGKSTIVDITDDCPFGAFLPDEDCVICKPGNTLYRFKAVYAIDVSDNDLNMFTVPLDGSKMIVENAMQITFAGCLDHAPTRDELDKYADAITKAFKSTKFRIEQTRYVSSSSECFTKQEEK